MAEPGRYPDDCQPFVPLLFAALGLGVLGLFSPFAWYMGWRDRKAIEEGRCDPGGRRVAVAALWLGAVGTIGWPIIILLFWWAGQGTF